MQTRIVEKTLEFLQLKIVHIFSILYLSKKQWPIFHCCKILRLFYIHSSSTTNYLKSRAGLTILIKEHKFFSYPKYFVLKLILGDWSETDLRFDGNFFGGRFTPSQTGKELLKKVKKTKKCKSCCIGKIVKALAKGITNSRILKKWEWGVLN